MSIDNPFMVDIRPEKSVQGLLKSLREQARAFVLDNKENLLGMTKLYAYAREWEKAINSKKKELLAPLEEVLELANEKVAAYLEANPEDKRDLEYVSVVEKTDVTITVTDLSKVPERYKTVDEKAIKRDVDLGIITIEGIEIKKEKTSHLRIK